MPYISLPVLGVIANVFFRINLYIKITKLLREYPDAVVYCRDLQISHWLIKFKKMFRNKVVFEAHSVNSWFLKNWHTWSGDSQPLANWRIKRLELKENRVFQEVDALVALTRRLKEVLIEEFGVNAKKIFVIPDATRLIPLEKRSLPRDAGKQVVGYAGQRNPSRGVDVLIEAMNFLDNRVELMIIGGSNPRDLERLEKLAVKLGIANKITLTGYIEPSKLNEYLDKADVLTMPHLDQIHVTNFASPLKMFEYMALKKPIVATDLLSTREILRDGENAVLVKPNDPQALALGIKQVLE